jgi:hypothetical protein
MNRDIDNKPIILIDKPKKTKEDREGPRKRNRKPKSKVLNQYSNQDNVINQINRLNQPVIDSKYQTNQTNQKNKNKNKKKGQQLIKNLNNNNNNNNEGHSYFSGHRSVNDEITQLNWYDDVVERLVQSSNFKRFLSIYISNY